MFLGRKKLMVKQVKEITTTDGTGKKLYFATLVDKQLFDVHEFMISEEIFNKLKTEVGKEFIFEISIYGKFLNINLI